MKKSTFYVKKSSLVMLMLDVLTYHVKNVQKENTENGETTFGKWLDDVIIRSGLLRKVIAKEAGIHPGSLSRFINDEGIALDTVRDIINAINKLKGSEFANMEVGIRLALKLPPQTAIPVEISVIDFSIFNQEEIAEIARFVQFIARIKEGNGLHDDVPRRTANFEPETQELPPRPKENGKEFKDKSS